MRGNRIGNYLSLVTFSHTIFAMPFALIGYTLALYVGEVPFSWYQLLLIIGAMVAARNSAMGFNRWADRHFDAQNRRTADREIPKGVISPRSALLFVVVNSLLFIAISSLLNRVTFWLSFVALAIVLGYSYSKRFTAFSHYILGVALSVAPSGAYIAITGTLHPAVLLLSLLVVLWVSGFDIIYSLGDEQFDRELSLFSVPSLVGPKWALIISALTHLLVLPLLWLFFRVVNGVAPLLGWPYIVGAALFSLLLIWQHLIVKPNDLSQVDRAFFTLNGIASILFALFTIGDLILF